MIEYYKKALPLTAGTFLSLLCIISLIEFVRGVDFLDLTYIWEVIPYFITSLISGLIGIPMFFYGLEKVVGKNG
jgi:hypothetical protein